MRKFAHMALVLLVMALSQPVLAITDPFGRPISESVIVSFADGSAQFKPATEQADSLAQANNAATVTIKGRTSTARPSSRDENLARARALAARSYLIAHGVSPLNIFINFASAADFIADNQTPAGRQSNQRVEVEMVFVTFPPK
jgi:outer membrane protein OmpA-like peptidoglycan-associated protein